MSFFRELFKKEVEILNILLIAGKPSGNFQGSFEVFSSLFIGLAFVLLAVGVILHSQQQYWLTHSHVTYGKIVDIAKRYSRDDHLRKFPTFFPVVTYFVDGHEFVKEADKRIDSENLVGSEIPIRYLDDDPTEATLNTSASPVLNPFLFFVLGGLLLTSAILLMVIIK